MDLARDHVRRGAGEGTTLLAACQTEGRGRLGRGWEAPAGLALQGTVILYPPAAVARSAWLTLAVGVACAEALRGLTDLDVRLKWPNDLRVGGRKLGGVLVETTRAGTDAASGELMAALVGLGININQTEDDFSPELRETATSLRLAGDREWEIDRVLDAILAKLQTVYPQVVASENEALRERWRQLDETIGRLVTVTGSEGEWHGRATAIDEYGALWIDEVGGEARRVVASDVSLKLEE